MEEASLLWNVVGTLLFTFSTYHAVTHACILFRWRMLPERDLVKQRFYFIIDLMTVFLTCFVYAQKLQWLAVIQAIQHAYYFITWNKTDHTIKVSDIHSHPHYYSHYHYDYQLRLRLHTMSAE